MGKEKILLTPGPSAISPSVRRALGREILHHRKKEFLAEFAELSRNLKTVFQTKNPVYIINATGTGGMEAAVVNTLDAGDRALVLSCGVFGRRWADIVKTRGACADIMDFKWGTSICPRALEEKLKKDGGKYKAVFFTHVETSTGALNPVKEICAVIRKHSAAFVVCDAISSVGAVEFLPDKWGIDVAVCASHKALGNSAGLAFVSVSPRALMRARKIKNGGFYFSFAAYDECLKKGLTPFTGSSSLILAQNAAIGEMLKKGIKNIWRETAQRAKRVFEFCGRNNLKMFSETPSYSVFAVEMPCGVSGNKILDIIERKHHLIAAGGQRELNDKLIRASNMGYVRERDIIKCLKAVREEI